MASDGNDDITGEIPTETDQKTDAIESTFTVEVLQMIKEAQQQHGLRHGDYQRYRSYCSRRLRRLRKTLHFPQGNKHKVNPKKITAETLKDVKFLHLPLTSAERAWSYAMQLKSEANTEPRKRWHLLGRLRKAVQHADEFNKLCESDKVDARTKLEAQAYSAWMKASLLFELGQWKTCIEQFSKAKTIYEKLCGAVSDDQEAVYRQRVEEISPNIRYCAYNIGDETAINDLMKMRVKSGKEDMLTSQLDELLSQTREKQAAMLSEVTWCGVTIPVKNESARLFLLNAQASESEVKQAEDVDDKVSILESLLKDSIDTLQNLRDELKSDQAFRSAQRGQKLDQPISKLHLLHSYITYIRITKTIQRNLLMIESLKSSLGVKVPEGKKQTKPQDLARLYDIIIQNLSEISHLAGVEDSSPIVHEVALKTDCYKTFRCFYMAQTYAGVKKWAEALALYERVSEYASSALQQCASSKTMKNDPGIKALVGELGALVKEVGGLKYSVHASSILDVDDTAQQMAQLKINAKKQLVDRLELYLEDPSLTSKRPSLVTFPPEFQPVPCKPLFFDLALNHVEMPSLEEKLEKKKSPAGLTGFVKGWLWGK